MVLLSELIPPELFRKAIAMKANRSLFMEVEAAGQEFWISKDDREFCFSLLSKSWKNFSEKEVQMVEMLALKYSNVPAPEDLAEDRVLN